ncbi:hypothetical protein FN846DRAFT_954581 [Sphaerosporella brunnea]|uniref:Uncharacterized protein n=1 Tax=Sphaerosporella brunnea TaxID=1250544 RepID=A0A5J5ETB1_9PEZI|nr:hypothetical protein FN846DRAFT_954581 [Sphaerosporella brunnea]
MPDPNWPVTIVALDLLLMWCHSGRVISAKYPWRLRSQTSRKHARILKKGFSNVTSAFFAAAFATHISTHTGGGGGGGETERRKAVVSRLCQARGIGIGRLDDKGMGEFLGASAVCCCRGYRRAL